MGHVLYFTDQASHKPFKGCFQEILEGNETLSVCSFTDEREIHFNFLIATNHVQSLDKGDRVSLHFLNAVYFEAEPTDDFMFLIEHLTKITPLNPSRDLSFF